MKESAEAWIGFVRSFGDQLSRQIFQFTQSDDDDDDDERTRTNESTSTLLPIANLRGELSVHHLHHHHFGHEMGHFADNVIGVWQKLGIADKLAAEALRSATKRRSAKHRAALKERLSVYLSYVNANLVLSETFQAGFYDWFDFRPFYREKFTRVCREQMPSETPVESVKQLFEISFPELNHWTPSKIVRALKDKRIKRTSKSCRPCGRRRGCVRSGVCSSHSPRSARVSAAPLPSQADYFLRDTSISLGANCWHLATKGS